MIKIRKVKKEEIDWVNKEYEKVAFKPSNFKTETIAIAELNNQRIGVGRLVKISAGNYELGGMLVFERFRGQGIARRIVNFLKQQAPKEAVIYCLPFKHLDHFYKSCGFREVPTKDKVPDAIEKKWNWGNQFYEYEVSLLYLVKKATPL